MKGINSYPGIYAIRDKRTGRIYIGSSKNVIRRWAMHCEALKGNRHYVLGMRDTFQKRGMEGFSFDVLEVVADSRKLLEREHYWMEQYPPRQLYNKQPWRGSADFFLNEETTISEVFAVAKDLAAELLSPQPK